MYFDYPLEQGLRRTKIINPASAELYFDYPLEQGLRQKIYVEFNTIFTVYFDYPLEQGLRHMVSHRMHRRD